MSEVFGSYSCSLRIAFGFAVAASLLVFAVRPVRAQDDLASKVHEVKVREPKQRFSNDMARDDLIRAAYLRCEGGDLTDQIFAYLDALEQVKGSSLTVFANAAGIKCVIP